MEEDDDIPLLPMRRGATIAALIDVHTRNLMVAITVIEIVGSPYNGYD